jgi:hypothetical protein
MTGTEAMQAWVVLGTSYQCKEFAQTSVELRSKPAASTKSSVTTPDLPAKATSASSVELREPLSVKVCTGCLAPTKPSL